MVMAAALLPWFPINVLLLTVLLDAGPVSAVFAAKILQHK